MYLSNYVSHIVCTYVYIYFGHNVYKYEKLLSMFQLLWNDYVT